MSTELRERGTRWECNDPTLDIRGLRIIPEEGILVSSCILVGFGAGDRINKVMDVVGFVML